MEGLHAHMKKEKLNKSQGNGLKGVFDHLELPFHLRYIYIYIRDEEYTQFIFAQMCSIIQWYIYIYNKKKTGLRWGCLGLLAQTLFLFSLYH